MSTSDLSLSRLAEQMQDPARRYWLLSTDPLKRIPETPEADVNDDRVRTARDKTCKVLQEYENLFFMENSECGTLLTPTQVQYYLDRERKWIAAAVASKGKPSDEALCPLDDQQRKYSEEIEGLAKSSETQSQIDSHWSKEEEAWKQEFEKVSNSYHCTMAPIRSLLDKIKWLQRALAFHEWTGLTLEEQATKLEELAAAFQTNLNTLQTQCNEAHSKAASLSAEFFRLQKMRASSLCTPEVREATQCLLERDDRIARIKDNELRIKNMRAEIALEPKREKDLQQQKEELQKELEKITHPESKENPEMEPIEQAASQPELGPAPDQDEQRPTTTIAASNFLAPHRNDREEALLCAAIIATPIEPLLDLYGELQKPASVDVARGSKEGSFSH